MTTEKPLHINDLFWTFQGEGLYAGRRALFVRLPFCNLACDWCDTSFNNYERWSVRDFVKFATSEPARFAVVTGGEPMMNKQASEIVKLLHDQGFQVAVESNGTFAPNAPYDFITVSPKRFTQLVRARTFEEQAAPDSHLMPPYYVSPEAYRSADEFKYVVDRGFDFSILDRHNEDYKNLGLRARLSLSPEFTEFKENLHKIEDYIAEHPHWRVSLQTHKWMEIK